MLELKHLLELKKSKHFNVIVPSAKWRGWSRDNKFKTVQFPDSDSFNKKTGKNDEHPLW